jgi:hypothetical protein
MEIFKIRTHVGSDGVLKLELPVDATNRDLEVVVVVQPTETEAVDELGWPKGFFEETYGSLADDPIERGDQGIIVVREPIE